MSGCPRRPGWYRGRGRRDRLEDEPALAGSSGRDLIEAGYEPGPRFKDILAAVEDAQLEGRLLSREAALEFVRRDFPA